MVESDQQPHLVPNVRTVHNVGDTYHLEAGACVECNQIFFAE